MVNYWFKHCLFKGRGHCARPLGVTRIFCIFTVWTARNFDGLFAENRWNCCYRCQIKLIWPGIRPRPHRESFQPFLNVPTSEGRWNEGREIGCRSEGRSAVAFSKILNTPLHTRYSWLIDIVHLTPSPTQSVVADKWCNA